MITSNDLLWCWKWAHVVGVKEVGIKCDRDPRRFYIFGKHLTAEMIAVLTRHMVNMENHDPRHDVYEHQPPWEVAHCNPTTRALTHMESTNTSWNLHPDIHSVSAYITLEELTHLASLNLGVQLAAPDVKAHHQRTTSSLEIGQGYYIMGSFPIPRHMEPVLEQYLADHELSEPDETPWNTMLLAVTRRIREGWDISIDPYSMKTPNEFYLNITSAPVSGREFVDQRQRFRRSPAVWQWTPRNDAPLIRYVYWIEAADTQPLRTNMARWIMQWQPVQIGARIGWLVEHTTVTVDSEPPPPNATYIGADILAGEFQLVTTVSWAHCQYTLFH